MTASVSAGEMGQARARASLVSRYLGYACERTDAPWEFHEAFGYVVLSAVIGRKAVLPLAQGDLYGSLWVMVLADSSLYRKSTAQDIAVDLLRRVVPDVLAPNDFTPQRFVAVMAERRGEPVVWARDEFSGFYAGPNKLDWMIGGKEALIQFHDCRPFCRELRKERFDIPEPFLSVMTASVKERFLELASLDDVLSGFLPRFAFVVPDRRPERRPTTGLTPEMEAVRDAVVEELGQVAVKEPCKMMLEPCVLPRWDSYQAELESQAAADPRGSLVGPINVRAGVMALKVAMMLGYVEGDTIGMEHLFVGMEVAERWRLAGIRLLGEIGPTEWEKKAAAIIELVNRKPGIGRGEVMRTAKLSKRQADDYEESLVERGQLRVELGGTTKPGRRYYPGENVRILDYSPGHVRGVDEVLVATATPNIPREQSNNLIISPAERPDEAGQASAQVENGDEDWGEV